MQVAGILQILDSGGQRGAKSVAPKRERGRERSTTLPLPCKMGKWTWAASNLFLHTEEPVSFTFEQNLSFQTFCKEDVQSTEKLGMSVQHLLRPQIDCPPIS